MPKNNFVVYLHTFPNKKVYIGITSQSLNIRWRKNGSGYKLQPIMWHAIQKYGWENIKHEILYTNLTEQEACQKEIELISKYDSTNIKNGYNQSTGGEKTGQGSKRSEEARKKQSLERMGEKNPMFNKHLTDEQKEKKLKASATKRKIICLDNKTTYESIREASRNLKIDSVAISRCCKKEYAETHGLHFQYFEDYLLNGEIIEQKKNYKVKCIELNKIYNSINEASKSLNISKSYITRVCNGVKEKAKGLHFEYIKGAK